MTLVTLPREKLIEMVDRAPVTRALLWKEWRESRRAFALGLFVLAGLPVALIAIIWVLSGFGEFGEFAGTTVVLSTLAGPLIASTLGAHAVCKDISRPQGRFLLAQPVSASRVIIVKGALAALLLLGLMIVPGVVALILSAFDAQTSVGIRLKSYIIYVSYVFALTGVLGVSLLAAALLRKLIAAILVGLIATMTFIVAPFMYAMEFLHWGKSNGSFAACGACGLIVFACAAGGAALVARRPDRAVMSMRRLSWGAVVLILLCTTLISDIFATNTRFTALVDRPGFQNIMRPTIWTQGGSVFWLGCQPSEGNSVYIGRATPDQQGGVTQQCRIALRDVYATRGYFSTDLEGQLSADGESLILLHHEYTSGGMWTGRSLTRFEVICDQDVAPGERLAHWHRNVEPVQSEHSEIAGRWARWAVDGDALFVVAWNDDSLNQYDAKLLQCFRLTGEQPALLAELPIDVPMCDMNIKNGTLSVWSLVTADPMLDTGARRRPRLSRIDVSDPEEPRILAVSQEYPNPSTSNQFQWMTGAGHVCAVQGNRLAMASTGGLWLYELEPNGAWKLIGQRESNWSERLVGRYPMSILWKGGRIYENSSRLGLIVYDAEDPKHPTRIAHTGGEIWGVVPIDEEYIALIRHDDGDVIEIHKLPD